MKEMIIDGVEYILTPKNNTNDILVPDNIQITESVGELGKGIVNGKQQLFYNCKDNHWIVQGYNNNNIIVKCKLTPCKYKDLEPGDVFYKDDNSTSNFDNLIGYAIKLEEGYQYWVGKDCIYSSSIYNYIWKVEQI